MRRRPIDPRPAPSDCPRCDRFTTWWRFRWIWRSRCCNAEHPQESKPRGPMVVEIVREGTLPDGTRFSFGIARPDLNPNTITRSSTP